MFKDFLTVFPGLKWSYVSLLVSSAFSLLHSNRPVLSSDSHGLFLCFFLSTSCFLVCYEAKNVCSCQPQKNDLDKTLREIVPTRCAVHFDSNNVCSAVVLFFCCGICGADTLSHICIQLLVTCRKATIHHKDKSITNESVCLCRY